MALYQWFYQRFWLWSHQGLMKDQLCWTILMHWRWMNSWFILILAPASYFVGAIWQLARLSWSYSRQTGGLSKWAITLARKVLLGRFFFWFWGIEAFWSCWERFQSHQGDLLVILPAILVVEPSGPNERSAVLDYTYPMEVNEYSIYTDFSLLFLNLQLIFPFEAFYIV